MDDIESIRRMTPDEKFQQWRALVRFSWKFFDLPDEETGRRKWQVWLREHDRSNANLLRALREKGR